MTSKSSLTPKIATLSADFSGATGLLKARPNRLSPKVPKVTGRDSSLEPWEWSTNWGQGRAGPWLHRFRFFFLVGGLEHALFSTIYEIILPIDFHMFQDGYCTTKQFLFGSECTKRLTISKYFIDHWRLVESHGNATRTCLYYYSMSYIYINTHIYI